MNAFRRLPQALSERIHKRGWKNHRPKQRDFAETWTQAGPRGPNQDRLLADEGTGLFAVFDGVGGLNFGGDAAQVARDDLADLGSYLPKNISAQSVLRDQTIQTNSTLYTAYEGQAATTLAGIYRVPEGLLVFHAGDSRVYRFRGGLLTRLTQDHRAGTQSQPRSGITRALGATDRFTLETRLSSIAPQDTFLICSDGIHDCVPHRQLELLMGLTEGVSAQSKAIAGFLNQKGPHDDATFVLVPASAL